MSVEEQGRHEFTRILRECREGDGDALERLMPLVYDELRRVANHYMQNERSGHTLQPTALVHEAYARLVGAEIEWESRVHFFRAAGRAMRRVLDGRWRPDPPGNVEYESVVVSDHGRVLAAIGRDP